jgi:hypothetical protein
MTRKRVTKNLIWCGIAFSIMLLVGGCGGDSSSSPAAQPTLRPGGSFAALGSTPTMNQAREDATATLLPNGEVFIAGGVNSTNTLASVELYDPVTNKFAPAASTPTMNTAHSNATATLLFNGEVLIAGGGANEGGFFTPLNTVDLYDPASNSFAQAASLPTMSTARYSTAAALLSNGEVLIGCGFGFPFPFANPLHSVELYNPVTNSFAPPPTTPTMGAVGSAPTATLLPDGKVLIAGGLAGFGILGDAEISNGVNLYDPVTNSFAVSTPLMNEPRELATATLLPSGKVLIAGGFGPGPGGDLPIVALSSVDLYDPASNSFAPTAALPTMNQARASATATLLNNGKVLIAGGVGTSNGILASVELYDPATNSFAPATATPTMNNGRKEATATLLPSGKVLIAGGTGVFGPLNTTDLYTQ